jgi:hypothetical protein
MWIEALPYAPWAVTNFPIDPGDQIGVTIFVADSTGNTWFNEPRGGGLTSRTDCSIPTNRPFLGRLKNGIGPSIAEALTRRNGRQPRICRDSTTLGHHNQRRRHRRVAA